jgi:hypothetical protein
MQRCAVTVASDMVTRIRQRLVFIVYFKTFLSLKILSTAQLSSSEYFLVFNLMQNYGIVSSSFLFLAHCALEMG